MTSSRSKDLPSAMKRYRIRQQSLVMANRNGSNNLSVSEVASRSRWTRGSVVSSFVGGELGSTLGRWMRSAGRVIIDPIDTFIGMHEFEKLYAYVIRLDAAGWEKFAASFDAEAYAPRIAEVARHRVYPRKLQVLAQKITLAFAILGKLQFEYVMPRIHFQTREEFEESITDLCATSLSLVPKYMLLSTIPVTDDGEDFLSSLRHEIGQSSGERKVPADPTLLYRLIDRTREPGEKTPYFDEEREVEMLRFVVGGRHPAVILAVERAAQSILAAERAAQSVLDDTWTLIYSSETGQLNEADVPVGRSITIEL